MPYVDPDDANQDVDVRFPGDPYPQPTTHNTFKRRESSVAEILGDSGLYRQVHVPEIEGLMAAPGTSDTMDAETVAEYGGIIETAYTDACGCLTAAQREAWDLEREGLTQRDAANKSGLAQSSIRDRLKGARRRLRKTLDWVIAPELKAKFHKPKPPAKPRPLAWTLTTQQIGTRLAYIDTDEKARWAVARLLDHALVIGMSPTDLCRRTGLLPTALAELVSDFRNG